MPKSRSPHGIQFDSPLQRQWMIRSSSGREALNASTVFGASPSSQRATKRIPAATISSTAETLSGAPQWRPARADDDLPSSVQSYLHDTDHSRHLDVARRLRR